jgi:hypothetical protein
MRAPQLSSPADERHGGHRPGACAWQRLFAPNTISSKTTCPSVGWPAFRCAVTALAMASDGAVWVGSAVRAVSPTRPLVMLRSHSVTMSG